MNTFRFRFIIPYKYYIIPSFIARALHYIKHPNLKTYESYRSLRIR